MRPRSPGLSVHMASPKMSPKSLSIALCRLVSSFIGLHCAIAMTCCTSSCVRSPGAPVTRLLQDRSAPHAATSRRCQPPGSDKCRSSGAYPLREGGWVVDGEGLGTACGDDEGLGLACGGDEGLGLAGGDDEGLGLTCGRDEGLGPRRERAVGPPAARRARLPSTTSSSGWLMVIQSACSMPSV